MANEYRLSYTAAEIDSKLGEIDNKLDASALNDINDLNNAVDEVLLQARELEEIVANLEDKINDLGGGVTLPELSNPAIASDILSGKEAVDGNGEVITGTIITKTSGDLTASGSTVTVPAGYYDAEATKSVATATRADTTISTTADDTNDKLTITASNNQDTGYVTGANKTATTTISLTTSGSTVIASDGTKSISKSVATATQATPSVSVSSSGLITASATQTAGYVNAGTKSGTKQLTTQAAKTITPSTSSQTAVASGVYTTGAVTVAAIPSNYEDVGTETSEYTLLNAELEEVVNSLPETGGSSGGGSVETCTVTFGNIQGIVTCLSVTDTGELSVIYKSFNLRETCPIVKGSFIHLAVPTTYIIDLHLAEGFTLVSHSQYGAIISVSSAVADTAMIDSYLD